jgi:hypothetical protein
MGRKECFDARGTGESRRVIRHTRAHVAAPGVSRGWCSGCRAAGRGGGVSDSRTITLGGEDYVVQPGDGVLKVGRPTGDDVTWLDDVDLGLLPWPARQAVEHGDLTDSALEVALLGVLSAETNRGG